MIKFKPAPAYYRLLNGILCVFKPAGECSFKVVEKLQGNLSRDLNSLLCYHFEETNDPHHSTDQTHPGIHSLPHENTNGVSDVNEFSPQSLPKLQFSLPTLPTEPISINEHSLTPVASQQEESVSASALSLTSEHLSATSNSVYDVHKTDDAYKLIYGERYLPSDFKMSYIDGLSRHSSGILLLGLAKGGVESVGMVGQSKLLRVYHVKGRLGYCTQNFSPKGKFIERASFRHVTQSKIDKVCATAQAAFSREMYRYSGISPDSQHAFDLAASGIIRPAERHTPPIVYGIKCIDYQPPDFTLEIHTINERCQFLQKLIHDLAAQLKSRAVCTGIRRLRYGYFDLSRALVRSQWNLENILNNIEENQKLLMSQMLD